MSATKGKTQMFSRNARLLVAVCALLATMAVAAVAQEEGETAAPGADAAQVTAIPEEASEAVAVLDRSRESGDALPAEVAEKVDEEAPFGANPDLSRRAIGSLSNSVYVVPADDHVCVALTLGEGANMSCPETDDLAAGQAGPTTVLLEGGSIAVYGVVPDGVDSVTVQTSGSGAVDAEIEAEGNAYLAVLPDGLTPEAASYTGPSGSVEFPLYDPSAE